MTAVIEVAIWVAVVAALVLVVRLERREPLFPAFDRARAEIEENLLREAAE